MWVDWDSERYSQVREGHIGARPGHHVPTQARWSPGLWQVCCNGFHNISTSQYYLLWPTKKAEEHEDSAFPQNGSSVQKAIELSESACWHQVWSKCPLCNFFHIIKSFSLGYKTLYTLWIHAQYSTIRKTSDLRGLRIGKTCALAIIARLVRCMHSQADSSWTSVLNLHRCGSAYRSSKSPNWRCFLDSIIALACHYGLYYLNFWECKAHRASSKLATF